MLKDGFKDILKGMVQIFGGNDPLPIEEPKIKTIKEAFQEDFEKLKKDFEKTEKRLQRRK